MVSGRPAPGPLLCKGMFWTSSAGRGGTASSNYNRGLADVPQRQDRHGAGVHGSGPPTSPAHAEGPSPPEGLGLLSPLSHRLPASLPPR